MFQRDVVHVYRHDAGRRLLADSIRVETSVKAADKAATASMSAKLTTDSINRELAAAGLPAATVLEVAAESADGAGSTTSTSSAERSDEGAQLPLMAIRGGGGGGGALVLALACAAFCYRRRRNRKPRLEEGTAVMSGAAVAASVGQSSC